MSVALYFEKHNFCKIYLVNKYKLHLAVLPEIVFSIVELKSFDEG